MDSFPSIIDRLVDENDPFLGYVYTIDKAYDVVKAYEHDTTTKFTVYTQTQGFGSSELTPGANLIQTQSKECIPFDGIPFCIVASKVLECQHGIDRNVYQKKKHAEKYQDGDFNFKKKRFWKHDTKKLNCPASIRMKEVIKFTDYMIPLDASKRKRKQTSTQVRTDIQQGTATQERRIYLSLPHPEEHTTHQHGMHGGMLQRLDDRLISKITQLVGEGIRSVPEMRRHLNLYVKNELFREASPPQRNNRRYFPKSRTIKNHMYNATVRNRLSSIDQENVQMLINSWQDEPGDKFFFRPYQPDCEEASDEASTDTHDDDDDEDDDCMAEDEIITKGKSQDGRLLFVHQTAWQSRLLIRYGQELAFLDATYKTTKYALPLFFIAVKTNVDYAIVASIVIQDETTQSITEALSIIKDWNPDWNPRHFMTDLCEEEINSLEHIFPDCRVLLCDFHREQAWERWTSKKENGVTDNRTDILSKMRKIARSTSEEEFEVNLGHFKDSTEWHDNQNMRRWFENTWLRHKERWVWAFRRERVLVYVGTNNGLERQHSTFKHQYLCTLKNHSLSGMLRILVEEFLPDKYEGYIASNTECSRQFKRYNTQIPSYLHERPNFLVDHCRNRLGFATDAVINVVDQTSGIFNVKSETDRQLYQVRFTSINDNSTPSCECKDWQKFYLPCKHMLSIIDTNEDWSWEKLPIEYRESPYLTLDKDVLFKCIKPQDTDNTNTDDNADNFPSINDNVLAPTATSDLPKKAYPKRSRVTRCCDLLASIKNLVHECTSDITLSQLEDTLKSALETLESETIKESGINLLSNKQSMKRKKKTVTPQILTKKLKSEIPKATKPHPYTGRHGMRAELMRKLYKAKIPLDEMMKDNAATTTTCNYKSNSTKTKTDQSGSFRNFTPIIKRGRKLTDTLLQNGPHSLSLLEIKSLEPHLNRGTEILLKSIDQQFQSGWLYDEVLNSFFWCLDQENSNILYIASTSMQVLEKTPTCERLFKGVDIASKDLIIAPWNPNGGHWTLVAVNLQQKSILYIDPSQTVNINSSIFAKLLASFMPAILHKQFGLSGFTIESPPHTLQKDTSSCGVLVCWYASQLSKGMPITDQMNTQAMRLSIFRAISGNCLQRFTTAEVSMSKCPKCESTVFTDWTACTRCRQWYHCRCLNLSHTQAKSARIIHCPP